MPCEAEQKRKEKSPENRLKAVKLIPLQGKNKYTNGRK
jgi:hypothetical protein